MKTKLKPINMPNNSFSRGKNVKHSVKVFSKNMILKNDFKSVT